MKPKLKQASREQPGDLGCGTIIFAVLVTIAFMFVLFR